MLLAAQSLQAKGAGKAAINRRFSTLVLALCAKGTSSAVDAVPKVPPSVAGVAFSEDGAFGRGGKATGV